MRNLQRFIKACCSDERGKVVLWQNPNAPIITWFVAIIASHLLPAGRWATLAQAVAFGALFTWAWLELFQGVNYFRRALGLVVLITILIGAAGRHTF
jgi:hypothetical protein